MKSHLPPKFLSAPTPLKLGRGRGGLARGGGLRAPCHGEQWETLGGDSCPEKCGPEGSAFREGLVAAAGPDNHVSVFLQDDVGAVIEVQDRDGIELSRGAARLGDCFRVDKVDLEHTHQNVGSGEKP